MQAAQTETAAEFDLGPLSWVQGEIDEALGRGLEALAAFRSEPGDGAALKHARAHVHQAAGAIQMVGLDAVAAFSDEIERQLTRLEELQAADVPGARFVTLDYDYSDQGRPQNGSDGLPLFVNTPGIKLRARANDGGGDPTRWGPWNTTVAFDLNNNNQPTVNIVETTGMFGVTPNATGTAADENVVLNLSFSDNDSDLMAVAVDWAQVPEAAFLGDPNVVAALQWFPATTFAGTADTNLPSSPGAGTPATYSWDSVADAGTVNGRFILRATPFDAKSELGPTATMDDGFGMLQSFRLDNYTIFTDPATALSQPRVGHRATTLANDRVLITGGRTTAAGSSVTTAELFFPGIGETTLGAVAATAPMATARSFHSQTRLIDDRVLVIGGFSAAGGVLNTVEVYDPVAGSWTTLGGANLATARARHAATLLPNGNVLVTGGVDGSGNALNSAEIFQVSNNDTVQVAEPMSAARHSVRCRRRRTTWRANTTGSPPSTRCSRSRRAHTCSARTRMSSARCSTSWNAAAGSSFARTNRSVSPTIPKCARG